MTVLRFGYMAANLSFGLTCGVTSGEYIPILGQWREVFEREKEREQHGRA